MPFQFTSQPPPTADEVAQRGTDQWRAADTRHKQWMSQQFARGATLQDMVDAGYLDEWGEEGTARAGRHSHDYEYWDHSLRGEAYGDEPVNAELGQAQWDVGNFQRQAGAGDFTEWPPGSGQFFNDPANDSSNRQWFNQYGDPIAPPADGGPRIDYNVVNGSYGGSIARYLKEEGEYRAKAAKAQGITPGANGATLSRPPLQQPTQPPVIGASVTGQPSVAHTNIASSINSPAWGVTQQSVQKPQRVVQQSTSSFNSFGEEQKKRKTGMFGQSFGQSL